MKRYHFSKQFPEGRRDKLRRRQRFMKHYEVKMRLKQVWYHNPRPKPSH